MIDPIILNTIPIALMILSCIIIYPLGNYKDQKNKSLHRCIDAPLKAQ